MQAEVDRPKPALDEDERLTCYGQRLKTPLVPVCMPIIANELCERMAYYGIMASLTLFFTRKLEYGNAVASTLTQLFSGLCYATALVGGWAADAHWGRYKTILVFITWYFVGMVGIAVSATALDNEERQPGWIAVFMIALFGFVGVGTGGIKPNVSTLGADQYDLSSEDQREGLDSFFNWFYWTINLGCIPAYTAIAYLCQTYNGGDFAIGYSIPAGCMFVSIVSFASGSAKYIKMPPGGCSVSRTARCLWHAVARKNGEPMFVWERALPALVEEEDPEGVLEDVKVFVGLILPWGALMSMYWTVYAQMSGPFYIQGCQMNLHIGGHAVPSAHAEGSSWEGGFEIPIAALNLFDSVTILVLVPICERWLFPALGGIMQWTLLRKVGTGFFFAALSMAAAAVTEHIRLQVFESCAGIGCSERLNGNVCTKNAGYNVSNMSVLWQVPQYAFIGISEVFASIGAMEFFYSQAPESMRSSSAALNLLTTALGTWFAAALTQLVNADSSRQWVTNDLNKGRFTDFFLLVGALMLGVLAGFVFFAQRYEYVESSLEEESSLRRVIGWSSASRSSFSAGRARRWAGGSVMSKTLIDRADQPNDLVTSNRIKFCETI